MTAAMGTTDKAEGQARPGETAADGAGAAGAHGAARTADTDGADGTAGTAGTGAGTAAADARLDEAHLTGGRAPDRSAGTARPEGGGRAAGGEAPAPARQWPMLVVAGGFALGLLVTAFGGFRAGALIMGMSMLAGAGMRWSLPAVGLLAVRSRFTDVITYSVFGTAIVLLALMIQPKPILEIPFLEDAVRFAVR
ncbi:DUF3017 domain-containing protein [Streptomyces sp. HB2AG]|uniref:DUF3017 domain-containing protein n=1 Tax=Streptomyces sp. HB2AG TaxID=2983400 RepID=UPI0022A9F78B|nr:DUF3017 domain-containing protein [Streptomyces sp. HB2AG]MCZ2527434.1 DUF3017 domain-containing protein [Streptomyces sp. HB2AG]